MSDVNRAKDKLQQAEKQCETARSNLEQARQEAFLGLPLSDVNWSFGRSRTRRAFMYTENERLIKQAQSRLDAEADVLVVPLSDHDLEIRLSESGLYVIANQPGPDALTELMAFGDEHELPPHFPVDNVSDFVHEQFEQHLNDTSPIPEQDNRGGHRQLYAFVPQLQHSLDDLLNEALDAGRASGEFQGVEPLMNGRRAHFDFDITVERKDE